MLTTRATARVLAIVAISGCILSISIHLISLAGFYSKVIFDFQVSLICGLFALGVTSPRLPGENVPKFLRRASHAIFLYFVVFFAVFTYEYFPDTGGERAFLQLLSAGVAAAYGGFAGKFAAYGQTAP